MASYLEESKAYANGVIDGSIVANKDRVLACQRFLNDLENDTWEFKEKDIRFVIKIIESTFVHIKGPAKGQPFLLEPWQKLSTKTW